MARPSAEVDTAGRRTAGAAQTLVAWERFSWGCTTVEMPPHNCADSANVPRVRGPTWGIGAVRHGRDHGG